MPALGRLAVHGMGEAGIPVGPGTGVLGWSPDRECGAVAMKSDS